MSARRKSGPAACAAGVLLAASLLLAGCAASSSTPGGSGGNGGSGGTSGSGTSTNPGAGTDLGDFKGVPPTFPKEIPIVSGDVPVGIDLGTGWTVIVKVGAPASAFAEAGDKLKSAGFTAQAEQSSDAGSFGDYIDAKYEVQVTAQGTSDYGPSLTYVVVLRG